MRWAERSVAAALFFLGIGVAWKATELPIGILPKEGPGGGFLPFWLSVGVAAISFVVFVQSCFQRPADAPPEGKEPEGEDPFISREGLAELLRVGGPGLIMILLIGVISIYFAAAAFVFYCLYFVGRHGLRTSLAVTVGVPIGVFLIFEKFLILPLPKGYLEFLFYLY